MQIDIVTIFPDYLAPLQLSLVGKAQRTGLVHVGVHDLRTFTTDVHRTVDDTPAGGGAGMVMMAEPWAQALETVAAPHRTQGTPTLIVPTPAGRPFTQAVAEELVTRPGFIMACGRYEGIDQRVIDDAATWCEVLPLSLGDYVLNGGEVAALAVVEAVVRLIPGVVGNPQSLVEESHQDGLLEYPVFTKPALWRGREIPPVLLSGDHGKVDRWRRDQQLQRTAQVRPDLIAALPPSTCDKRDLAVLAESGWTVDAGVFVREDTVGSSG